MKLRVGLSQAKFKIWYVALSLREFTVKDLVRVTGLNPESVSTEIQRMKKRGLIKASRHPEKPVGRGARPSLYRLTDDPEQRLAMSRSVEAFYGAPDSTGRPTSRYYLWAKQQIDRAQLVDRAHREELLTSVEEDLAMAEQAEGSAFAAKSVKNYLDYERARLMFLRGQEADAELKFRELREFFNGFRDDQIQRLIDEYLLCLEVRKRCLHFALEVSTQEWALHLLEVVREKGYRNESPLFSQLLELVGVLTEPPAMKFCFDAMTIAASSEAEQFPESAYHARGILIKKFVSNALSPYRAERRLTDQPQQPRGYVRTGTALVHL